jgi:hypothetical protein
LTPSGSASFFVGEATVSTTSKLFGFTRGGAGCAMADAANIDNSKKIIFRMMIPF